MRAGALCIVLVLWAVPAGAQVPGAQLDDGAFDAGIGVRFVERDVVPDDGGNEFGSDYHVTGAYFRYGVNDWFTLSGEAAMANTHALETQLNETNWDSRYVLAGAGMQVSVLGGGRWRVNAGVHVTRAAYLSREENRCNERNMEWLAVIHAERILTEAPHRVVVWGGPSYQPYLRFGCGGTRWESRDDWGGAVGVDVRWYARVNTFAHAVYAGRLQPRVGIGWHFR